MIMLERDEKYKLGCPGLMWLAKALHLTRAAGWRPSSMKNTLNPETQVHV
jgi:hypothetical protein